MLFLDIKVFFLSISPILLFSSVNLDILNFLNKDNSSCVVSLVLLLIFVNIPSEPITTSLLNL